MFGIGRVASPAPYSSYLERSPEKLQYPSVSRSTLYIHADHLHRVDGRNLAGARDILFLKKSITGIKNWLCLILRHQASFLFLFFREATLP